MIISSQFIPKRPTQTIFDLGPKERFKMIREVHNAHQKSLKKNSKKFAKRNRSKRNLCSLAPSSRHYLPAYPKQEVSQSIYNIIVPCIVFSCYFIPKIIQETFYSLRRDSTVCFTEHAAYFNSHAYSKTISKEFVVPLFMTDEEFKAYKNVLWKSVPLRNLRN